MPVYLDAIPDLAPKIRRPDTRRWLYLLGFMMVVGNALTFWLWTSERAGFVFWFIASGVPFCLWGLIFSIRRFGYKCDQVWASSWNRERSHLLEQEMARGRRNAWILNAEVISQDGYGAGKLLNAVNTAASQLSVQRSRAGGTPIRHSRLRGFQDKQQHDDFHAEIQTAVSQFKPILASVPRTIPCWLMVDCDVTGIPDANKQVLDILTSQTGRQFRVLDTTGLTAFDLWLDHAWKTPAVFIAVSAVVRATPQENEGEAITYLLLLNRAHPDFPDAVRLHRPEKGNASLLSKTLGRALLWCGLSADELKGSWTTGKALAQGGEWNSACEENRLAFSMTENNQDIDQITGYTGKAGPWLAITLASTVAQHAGSQIVAVETGTEEVWVVGITTAIKQG